MKDTKSIIYKFILYTCYSYNFVHPHSDLMEQQSSNSPWNFDQRQIYGEEFSKIVNLRIFLQGLGGVTSFLSQLGIEVAKNIIMNSPKKMTICDMAIVA